MQITDKDREAILRRKRERERSMTSAQVAEAKRKRADFQIRMEERIAKSDAIKAAAFDRIVEAMKDTFDDPTLTVNQACREIVRRIKHEIRSITESRR